MGREGRKSAKSTLQAGLGLPCDSSLQNHPSSAIRDANESGRNETRPAKVRCRALARPSFVTWSAHARIKARELGASVVDIEDGLLANHSRRTANPGAAQWRLRVGPWVITYDHPVGDDQTQAKIV